jgi:nucleolar complex protein 3
MPELEDPEYCNANSTLLYELHHHSRHYHPLVRRFGSHLLSSCKGNQLTIEMTKKRPLELYEEMSCSDDQDITFPTFNTSILTSNVSKKTRYNTSFINEETSITSNGYKMLSQMK